MKNSAGAADLSLVPPPEPERQTVEAVTALVVLQTHDGTWVATNDLTKVIVVDRQATPDDMYAGCAVACKDLLAHESAMHAQMLMVQQAKAAMEQAQNAATLAHLGGSIPRNS